MKVEEEPGKCTQPPPGYGLRHLRKDSQKITSGKSRWQQGLVATCKDSLNEAKAEGEESQMGLANESIGAMNEE
jgi:hypothetical protein